MNVQWLEGVQKKELDALINDTIIHELETRHWGAEAKGSSPNGVQRVYISDIRGLYLAAGAIRYKIDGYGGDLLYRGQNKDWELVPSLYRQLHAKGVSIKDKQYGDVDSVLERKFELIKGALHPIGTVIEREALAQHYGIPTRCLDAVDHIQTAAWFAYHAGGAKNGLREDEGFSDDVGFIELLGVPRESNDWKAIDLRKLSSEFLRPHVQQAFSIVSLKQLNGRFFGQLNILNFIVPNYLLKAWSNYDVISPDIMFPNIKQDKGCYYAEKCYDILKKAGLDTSTKKKSRRNKNRRP